MNTPVIAPSVRNLAEKIHTTLAKHFDSTYAWQDNVPGDHARAVAEHAEQGIVLVANLIAQDKIDALGLPQGGFEVGDQVQWTSQAGGVSKTKSGVVAEVVRAKGYPDQDKFRALYKSSGVGLHRDHVSYVVLVKNKIYWPVAKKLSRAQAAA